MILVEVPTGILAWRKHDIATIMPDVRGRHRVVRCCGMVAHIPGPPPPGPWVQLDKGWGNEHWLQLTEGGWKDPAGFLFPVQVLEKSPPPPELPQLQGLDCPRDQIVEMHLQPDDSLLWKTDQGEFRTDHLSVEQACELMPELARLRAKKWINRDRIHSIALKSHRVRVTMDNGCLDVMVLGLTYLAKDLGITSYWHLTPLCKEFWAPYYVRDWPMDLLYASGETLRQLFPNSKMLSGNLIWQRFRYISQGDQREWPDNYSDMWYIMKTCLNRSGFLRPASKRALSHEEKLQDEIFDAMSRFVKQGRFFNFRQFGFREQHPERRRIGGKRGHILFITEKRETAETAKRIAEEFDLSLILFSGQPPMIATEFFAAALLEAGIDEIWIIALVDYDPPGWSIARATGKQLSNLGIRVNSVDFLIRGETFTEEEKRLYSHPLPPKSKSMAPKWMAETNGVDGQVLGIHANHVQPFERVRGLFQDWLAQLGAGKR